MVILSLALSFASSLAIGAERFPPPEFETEHALPETHAPPASHAAWEYIDATVFLVALSLATYLTLRRRSRRGVAWLGVFSLVYFGFLREGCVCPIGATQNVTLALFDATYAVPTPVILFFFLPLAFTLFFGRGFCAAVCPLGAIQDVVILRPVRMPAWLEHPLRLLAYVYLGLAVYLVATGAAFVICRYDPFVSFFRLSGTFNMLVLGGLLLLIGVFVARPYCRYLCPYGVLLGIAGRFSSRRVTITPDKCIRCRLCEDSCPFGAIQLPTQALPAAGQAKARQRLIKLILLLPIIVVLFAWIGHQLGGPLSRAHPKVKLAEQIYVEQAAEEHVDLDEPPSDEGKAFLKTGQVPKALYTEAALVRGRFLRGGWWFGAWVGLVIALKLIHLSLLPRRTDYEADRASCLACSRCYDFCPEEHERRKRNVKV